jgi:hypothetical protein
MPPLIPQCSYRFKPSNSLTQCGGTAYGKCAGEHKVESEFFCFDHLEQCRKYGKMFCKTHMEAHNHGEIQAA